jgi:hypothetical protein
MGAGVVIDRDEVGLLYRPSFGAVSAAKIEQVVRPRPAEDVIGALARLADGWIWTVGAASITERIR